LSFPSRFAVIALLSRSAPKERTPFQIKMGEAVLGVTALVVIFNIYTIYQQNSQSAASPSVAEKKQGPFRSFSAI